MFPEVKEIVKKRLLIKGVVQGVGFRPFVYRLAKGYGLKGFVKNTGKGVLIEIEGPLLKVEQFKRDLFLLKPPASKIDSLEEFTEEPEFFKDFFIEKSEKSKNREVFVPPDIATCKDCLKELFDKNNRRYRYPFINCTNCGPRYTIILDIPYDRPKTTMKEFKMCSECDREYKNPLDRRFHAQPNACPQCGPSVFLFSKEGKPLKTDDPIKFVVKALKVGKIVAIKGLGGFHLACDAKNEKSVKRLREIKKRGNKPFAIMVPSLEFAKKYFEVSDEVQKLLNSPESPIVIVRTISPDFLSPSVAPGLEKAGIMLPYTPLHHLILKEFNGPVVMTSANISDKPLHYKNDKALNEFKNKVDLFLMHNRKINIPVDDSVINYCGSTKIFIRRARGYVPLPIEVPFYSKKTVLGAGGALKATFAVLKKNKVFLSQHIGNLFEYENFKYYLRVLEHFKKIFNFKFDLVVHDLHPAYPSTEWAKNLGLPAFGVQHHKAHLASLMAENKSLEMVIGFVFDGTGYGEDGKIWGGEVLVGSLEKGFQRVGHLGYFPLVGGDSAIKEPWKIAFTLLKTIKKEAIWRPPGIPETKIFLFEKFLNGQTKTVKTSSMGRLFDAVSALLGLCPRASYEAEAAILLEEIADKNENSFYNWKINEKGNELIFDPYEIFSMVLEDFEKGVPKEKIAARFHNAIARAILKISKILREKYGISKVALTGGVFQNSYLLDKASRLLKSRGFEIIFHRYLPPNDGSIALGQVAMGVFKLKEG